MIAPSHPFRIAWNVMISLLTLFVAVETPLRIVVGYPGDGWLYALDWVVVTTFLADIGVQFRTTVVEGNQVVDEPGEVARRYLRGWFTIDLIAALPVDLVLGAVLPLPFLNTRMLRLLRLFRVVRLIRFWSEMQTWQWGRYLNPSLVRLTLFGFWIGLALHWVACGWLAMQPAPDASNPFDAYVIALYWAVTTLTTVGYGDVTPHNNLQRFYTMFVMVLGVGVYGYVIGNVSSLLSNLDVARATYQERLENIDRFMKLHSVPPDLQKRVRDYYSYLWHSRHGQEDAQILHELPPSLRTEMSLHLNRGILHKVPLFAGAPEGMLVAVATALEPEVYAPGDRILRHGEVGEAMYFVHQGAVDVIAPHGPVVATLHEGDYFGELAVLLRAPRSATIRSRGYTEVFRLDRPVLDHIVENYPDFAERLHEQSARREAELLQNPPEANVRTETPPQRRWSPDPDAPETEGGAA